MKDDQTRVSDADLDRCLARIQTNAAGRQAGVFGPGSMIWRVDREAAVFLGAGRALLMQLAHPWVATAIAQHSTALFDPIGRFHRTFEIVFTLVFGSLDQALATARRLHRRHSGIGGTLPEALGRYQQGSAYLANDSAALMWVHATLTDTALVSYELVFPPLRPEAREHYYKDCSQLGLLFGLPEETQPRDWPAFTGYRDAMLASHELAAGPAAREIAARVLSGAGGVPVPQWYRNITAFLLPERPRESFGLPLGEQERRRAQRALRAVQRLYPKLPCRLRHVGPYQEAVLRLSGRGAPDLWTRSLNRLWMGRSAMGD